MPALHHVAFACRDLDATHHFYEDLLGFPLVYTEVDERRRGYMKHAFYDIGDGSCIAFFDLHGMGEPDDLKTAISTDLDLPVWVNHVAIRADEQRVRDVKARLDAENVSLTMELDHGWCRSAYVVDPNGILVEFTIDTPGFQPDPVEADRLRREPVASPTTES